MKIVEVVSIFLILTILVTCQESRAQPLDFVDSNSTQILELTNGTYVWSAEEDLQEDVEIEWTDVGKGETKASTAEKKNFAKMATKIFAALKDLKEYVGKVMTDVLAAGKDILAALNNYQTRTIEFKIPEEFPIKKNNKLVELPFLGKEYNITFDLFITEDPSGYENFLHFSNEGGNFENHRCRTPAAWIFGGSRRMIRLYSLIDGHRAKDFYPGPLSLKTWQSFEISQYFNGTEMVFNMKLDGSTEVEHINSKPQAFKNVKIYAGDPWNPPAKGKMRNLVVETSA